MARHPSLDPATRLEVAVPQSLRVRIDLLLFSEVEGRVPHGAYSEYFCRLAREDFERRHAGESSE